MHRSSLQSTSSTGAFLESPTKSVSSHACNADVDRPGHVRTVVAMAVRLLEKDLAAAYLFAADGVFPSLLNLDSSQIEVVVQLVIFIHRNCLSLLLGVAQPCHQQ